MKKQFFYSIISPLLLFTLETFGQKNTVELGGKLINELTFSNQYAPGIGVQVIYRMSNKSGIESGLYFKTRPYSYNLFPPVLLVSYHIEVTERNILFPVLYRFDSHAINFTIGPVLEYYIGWKQRLNKSDIKITEYSTDRLELISTASISRNFNLSPALIFEPEIRFSAFVPNGDGGFGLNLSLRKKIF